MTETVTSARPEWPAANVEMRQVSDLVPYARNSRTHSPEQVDQIAASIREWGWTTPVLVDEAGMIIAGHGRVLAAQKLGISEVPVMTARGWTEAQKKAYIIADNKLGLNAGWDDDLLKIELQDLDGQFDLTKIGFSERELNELLTPADLEAFGDDADTSAGTNKLHLAIGKERVPITEAEQNALLELLKEYTEQAGVRFGFASWLLEGRDAAASGI